MEKLSKMESFESFKISKKSMNQIAGSGSKHYIEDSVTGRCGKYRDRDYAADIIKYKDRFDDRCD